VAKTISKFRKNHYYDEDYEYEKKFSSKNIKVSKAEVKKVKNKTISKLKNPSYDQVMDLFADEERYHH
jgi:hypothetical protein